MAHDDEALCVCKQGFAGGGHVCEDVDECLVDNGGCHPNASCTNTVGSRACVCAPGYEGDGVACADADECLDDNGGCDANATCVNQPGTFACACDAGYEGDGVSCADVDECLAGEGVCDANATCANSTGSFSCTCNDGFAGDGMSCADVDECLVDNGGCDPNAVCTNTVGSFGCACGPGYQGDGAACADIDECTLGNGGCDPNAVCTNTPGSSTCTCNVGYEGSGTTCADVDECLVGNGGCDPHATCTNGVGTFACACDPGFSGDGLACADIDECLVGNGGCHLDATCTNAPGSFACACNPGYQGDGVACTDVDECTANNGGCDSNATCTNSPGSFGCTCNAGFIGDGFTCACAAPPPAADAGQAATIDTGQSYTLDALGTTGGAAPLSFEWVALGAAPPPPDPNSAVSTVLFTGCGVFAYQLTVTDFCGQQSTDTVTVSVLGNGPYVSKSTCAPSEQCGTIAKPWCEIAGGVVGSATYPVRVASGLYLSSGVVLPDGAEIVGGYEPTFVAPRDPNPATNGVVLETGGTAFTWPAGVAATIDGVRIVATGSSQVGTKAYLQVNASAAATIVNTLLEPDDIQPKAGTVLGVLVMGTANLGAGATIEAPNASQQSQALNAAGNASVVVNGATLVGGDVAGASGSSHGILHTGIAQLIVQSATVSAGNARITRGIEASTAPGYAGTQIVDTDVSGGTGYNVAGVRHVQGPLTISGGTIAGGASSGLDLAQRAVGVEVVGPSIVDIQGVTVTGATGSGTTTAYGLLLPAPAASSTVTVAQSTVLGGTQTFKSYGIFTDGVPFEVSGSTIVGGAGTGAATDAHGIHVQGSFAAATLVDIHDNAWIEGHANGNGNYGTAGVHVDSTVPVVVDSNDAIVGCGGVCTGYAAGIYARTTAPALTITNNTVIEGGPSDNVHAIFAMDEPYSGVGSIVVTSNGIIAGNLDPDHWAKSTYGITVSNLISHVVGNGILGGYHSDLGDCIAADLVNTTNTQAPVATVSDNHIGGCTGTVVIALREWKIKTDVQRNVIDACGMPPSGVDPSPLCVKGTGVRVDDAQGSFYANNLIFGGTGKRNVAMDIDHCSTCSITVAHNLLYVPGGPGPSALDESYATALRIANTHVAGTIKPVVRNNIIDPGVLSDNRRSVLLNGQGEHYVLENNDLVLTGGPQSAGDCLLEVQYLSWNNTIAQAQSYGTASNNCSIDPAYVAPLPYQPAAAGYHIGATCNLADLGQVIPAVPLDYDLDARGAGSGNWPDLGPDECL